MSVTGAFDQDLYGAADRAGYRTELVDEEEDDQLETIRCVLHAAVLGEPAWWFAVAGPTHTGLSSKP